MTQRLKKKYETARKHVPAPVLHKLPGAKAGILAFGSTESAVLEAQHDLAANHDLKADFMRVRAIPLTQDVRTFVETHEPVFVVEMNRDGQMAQLLTLEYPEHAMRLRSVAFEDGLPAAAGWIRTGILAKRGKSPAAGKPMKTASRLAKKPAARKTAVKRATTRQVAAAKPRRK
jgi:2-oxoglutarate ferredoxin oxidoreductase subunit alpha